MKVNKNFKRLIVLICVIIICIIYVIVQNNWIQSEAIEVEVANLPQELDNFTIAHVSDVHLPRNASDIETIIQMVKEQEPDITVVTGDIIDRSANISTSDLHQLCAGLAEISPAFAVSGNHEKERGDISEWRNILTENGIQVIDDTFEIIEIGTARIAVMGLGDFMPLTEEIFATPEIMESDYRVLLAHRPELWDKYYSAPESIRPDLVFTGHAHGGQVRIPFVGGLIAPDQGFFPDYTSGLYVAENGSKMVLSRGLGNSVIPVRINNRPHLPVVTITALGE